ncbi:hypothetical protein [Streptomyces sp. NPDC003077]|uniref:hypothetical protein n=1 Tax=Streptomyces sp. NPDC003077 TaxID=3154443 RepID=UPI0033B7D89A
MRALRMAATGVLAGSLLLAIPAAANAAPAATAMSAMSETAHVCGGQKRAWTDHRGDAVYEGVGSINGRNYDLRVVFDRGKATAYLKGHTTGTADPELIIWEQAASLTWDVRGVRWTLWHPTCKAVGNRDVQAANATFKGRLGTGQASLVRTA